MSEPRYRIVESIGRGGMGEVCLADDVMLRRQVALKFLTDPREADGLEQLLDEARAAAALTHPFICAIYEVTALDGRPCIAMEYVHGETLERRLRRGPLRLIEALRVADEIAEALEAAHRRWVVHRDLKPANVMLTTDGHIKVMDFGLAARLPHADGPDPLVSVAGEPVDILRGTPAYMSPEQIRGDPPDRRSDIFSFGILLYELLSGTNPFIRLGVEATLLAILNASVDPLHVRQSSIPPALDGVLGRLLAKEPADRYASFGDVRNDLRRLAMDMGPSSTVAPPTDLQKSGIHSGVAPIGHHTERAQLHECLRDAKAGRGRFIVLVGEAGAGKTRLADDALAAARQSGFQTLVGRCGAQAGTPALLPFIELLEEASRLMPIATFRQSVGTSGPELARLVPGLHHLFPGMPPPLELPPQLRQRFLFTSVRDFLARSAHVTPLAVFIDDLQWADESTLLLTQQLASQLATLPILVIAAFREADGQNAAPRGGRLHTLLDRVRGQKRDAFSPQAIQGAIDRLVSEQHARAIALRPFTASDVQQVLAALAQSNPPASLARQFAEHTGGNPFFVTELFRQLQDEGRLFDAQRRWKRDLDLDAVDLPDTVRVVLERRMQRVSPETQQVLRAAAVIGRQFDPDLLEQISDVDNDRLSSALAEAERARIVVGPSGRRDVNWRFTHQLTCQLLTGGIPQGRRQRLHLRVAEAMARLDHESSMSVSAIAHHLYCAGRLADPVTTARALVTAGERAHALYATEEAIQHYRRALEVLQETNGDQATMLSVQETLADLLALIGERALAIEQYQAVRRAHQAAHASVGRARLARKTGALLWQAGERGDAMAEYRCALDELSGSTAPLEAAHLYQELGLAAFRTGDNERAVEWSERALQAAEEALAAAASDDPPTSGGPLAWGGRDVRKMATVAIAQATNTIGVALARSGQLEAARERIERSLASAQALGLLDVACRAYANLGVLYSSVEPRRAIEVSLTGLEIASRIGAASLQSHIYANLAAAYCALTDGCETEGLQAAQAAAALDRELGQRDHLAVPLIVMAQIHQCRGELEQADKSYREALTLAEQIGEPQLILPCYDGLATIYLDRGDRARAEEFLERGRQLCARTGLDPDTILLLPFLC